MRVGYVAVELLDLNYIIRRWTTVLTLWLHKFMYKLTQERVPLKAFMRDVAKWEVGAKTNVRTAYIFLKIKSKVFLTSKDLSMPVSGLK